MKRIITTVALAGALAMVPAAAGAASVPPPAHQCPVCVASHLPPHIP